VATVDPSTSPQLMAHRGMRRPAGLAIKLPKTKGHHTWTDDEIEQYRAYWPLGTQQRLVMESPPSLDLL
jgi:hypothetical protein